MCLVGLVDPGLCDRIEVHAHRSFVMGIDRHALQTQFPPSGIELRDGPQFRLPGLHSISTTAAATNPIATPINGLNTANQKEMFQSEFSGVGFFFMPLSQAFEDRYFRKHELPFDMPPRRFFENGNENAQGVIAQHRAPGDPRNRLGLGNCHRAAVVVCSSKCPLG
jgi:hypothetical protein